MMMISSSKKTQRSISKGKTSPGETMHKLPGILSQWSCTGYT